MNNPNPFVPKGSILEAQSKRRSRLKLAVFCVIAVGVAGLSAMLIQGCKREQPTETTDITTPKIDTNVTPATSVTDTSTPPMTVTSSVVTPPVVIPPVVVPPEPAATKYTIVAHDTYSTIAKKFNVLAKALEAANPGKAPTKLKVGDTITIPAPAAGAAAASSTTTSAATDMSAGGDTYKVKSGDTLGTIAKAHGVSLKALVAANNLTPDQINHIKVNQVLKLPAKAEVAAPVPVVPEPAPAAPAPVAPVTPPPGTMPGH